MADWREGYKQALRDFMLREGRPMRMEESRYSAPPVVASYYGWTDWEAQDHFSPYRSREKGQERCSPVAPADATITEEHYHQFQGTFYSGTDTQSFLVMHPVSCACGRYKDLYWGFEGSMGEVITGVLHG